MTLQAADIDNIRFATVDRGYSEAEVDEFVAKVGITLAAAEAAVAHAPVRTGVAAEGAAEASSDLVPVAARLLELAQTAADEQLAAAHSEAERVVTEARAHADQLVADAHSQAAAAKADAEQTAARLVQSARDKEAEVQAQVGRLQETQQSSRRDLRALAQHLIAIAGTDEGDAPPGARPEDERH